MNTRQRNVWRKIRQKGQFSFILGGTVLIASGGTIISILIDYGLEFFISDAPRYLHESERLASKLLIRLLILVLAGIYVSYYLWNKNEEIFLKVPEEK